MYCSNCGSYNRDDAKSCWNCGTELQPPPLPGTPAENDFQFESAALNNYPAVSLGNPLYSVLQRTASSKLFLTAIIFFGLTVFLTFAGNIAFAVMPFKTWSNPFMGQFENQYGNLPFLQDMQDMQDIYNVFSSTRQITALFVGVICLIPPLLIFIGMLMTYVSAVRSIKTGGLIRTGGLMMIKVIRIISLVMICIFTGLALLLTLISVPLLFSMTLRMGSESLPPSAAALIITAFIFIFGLLALVITYQAKVVKIIGGIKNFAAGGAPYMKPSMFVIVIGFANTGFMVLFNIAAALMFRLPSSIAAIFGAAATILLLALLCRYRSEMIKFSAQMQS